MLCLRHPYRRAQGRAYVALFYSGSLGWGRVPKAWKMMQDRHNEAGESHPLLAAISAELLSITGSLCSFTRLTFIFATVDNSISPNIVSSLLSSLSDDLWLFWITQAPVEILNRLHWKLPSTVKKCLLFLAFIFNSCQAVNSSEDLSSYLLRA